MPEPLIILAGLANAATVVSFVRDSIARNRSEGEIRDGVGRLISQPGVPGIRTKGAHPPPPSDADSLEIDFMLRPSEALIALSNVSNKEVLDALYRRLKRALNDLVTEIDDPGMHAKNLGPHVDRLNEEVCAVLALIRQYSKGVLSGDMQDMWEMHGCG